MARPAVLAQAGARSLRRALRIAAVLVAAAVWIYAATRLWQTTVPDGLDLPVVDVHDWFTPKQLADATSFERFLAIDRLLGQVALVAVLLLYARNWQRFTSQSAAGRIGTGL